MKKLKTPKTLTGEEYAVLYKVARKTRMDCWFEIRQNSLHKDYIYDLEDKKKLSLKDGINLLCEGLDCQENYDNCFLAWYEKVALRNLFSKLGITVRFDWKLPKFHDMSKALFLPLYKEAELHNVYCLSTEMISLSAYRVGDVTYCFEGDTCFNVSVDTRCVLYDFCPNSEDINC